MKIQVLKYNNKHSDLDINLISNLSDLEILCVKFYSYNMNYYENNYKDLQTFITNFNKLNISIHLKYIFLNFTNFCLKCCLVNHTVKDIDFMIKTLKTPYNCKIMCKFGHDCTCTSVYIFNDLESDPNIKTLMKYHVDDDQCYQFKNDFRSFSDGYKKYNKFECTTLNTLEQLCKIQKLIEQKGGN